MPGESTETDRSADLDGNAETDRSVRLDGNAESDNSTESDRTAGADSRASSAQEEPGETEGASADMENRQRSQIMAMGSVPDGTFRFAGNEEDGNLSFLEREGYVHDATVVSGGIRNCLQITDASLWPFSLYFRAFS